MSHYDLDPFGYDDYDDDFAGPNTALRAASASNPRNLPCPTCGHPNRLTPADARRGYQCDDCADALEYGGEIDYYEDDVSLMTPEIIEQYVKGTFDVLYGPCGGIITVEGAGTEVIRVTVALPDNKSLSFVCELCSDGDVTKLFFTLEGYYANICVDLSNI